MTCLIEHGGCGYNIAGKHYNLGLGHAFFPHAAHPSVRIRAGLPIQAMHGGWHFKSALHLTNKYVYFSVVGVCASNSQKINNDLTVTESFLPIGMNCVDPTFFSISYFDL